MLVGIPARIGYFFEVHVRLACDAYVLRNASVLKLLLPVLSRGSGDFQLGVCSFPELDSRVATDSLSTQHCPIVFGTEQSSVIEKRLMSRSFGGINPYGYKVWDDRINAFRVIASVDTFELARDQSEQIDEGVGYEILTANERAAISHAYLGLSAREAASATFRSVATVRAHRLRARRKLGTNLTPIALARAVFANRAIEEMNSRESRIGLGNHYTALDL